MTHRNYTLRKQDHGDFSRRVKRIDPRFFRMGDRAYAKDETKPHVLGAALIGFGWAYSVAAIGNGRGHIEASLRQGTLSAEAQHWILSALAAVLAASLVMLAVHMVRVALTRGARRRNSRALLSGAVLAFAMFYMPAAVWDTGFALLDGRSQSFLAAAGALVEDSLPALNINTITFATSRGF
ncbi:hypothetical protein [Maliponia aquimaris]|nr:hypothetical protein [Maliponia aquimaris]